MSPIERPTGSESEGSHDQGLTQTLNNVIGIALKIAILLGVAVVAEEGISKWGYAIFVNFFR